MDMREYLRESLKRIAQSRLPLADQVARQVTQQNAQLLQRVHQPDTNVPARDDLEVAACKLPATSSTPAKPCLRLVQRPRTVGSPPQHELQALLAPTMTEPVNASLISCAENYDDGSSHV